MVWWSIWKFKGDVDCKLHSFLFFFSNMNIKVLIRRNAIIINCSINFENVIIAFYI